MISVIVATYNSAKYLPDFLDSILEQSYFTNHGIKPKIFIIDNASSDGTVKIIKDNYPTVSLLRNVNNIGLPRAWNQAIKLTQGEYLLVMNPDLILDKDFLTQAVQTIKSDQTIASVGGKLYRLKTTSIAEDGLHSFEKTNQLDSCGIKAFKNRRFVERGSGELDSGQFNKQQEVFGVSGALTLFRRSALEKVKFIDEYFDEDFFLYKEDIDMAWRLRLAGYINVYNPRAIAYHDRRARSQKYHASNYSVAKHRRGKESLVNYHSYKNHILLLYKNSLAKNFRHHFPYIFWYELKKFIYVLIFENSTFRHTIRELFRLRKKFKQKRRLNMRLCKIQAEEIGQWFI